MPHVGKVANRSGMWVGRFAPFRPMLRGPQRPSLRFGHGGLPATAPARVRAPPSRPHEGSYWNLRSPAYGLTPNGAPLGRGCLRTSNSNSNSNGASSQSTGGTRRATLLGQRSWARRAPPRALARAPSSAASSAKRRNELSNIPSRPRPCKGVKNARESTGGESVSSVSHTFAQALPQ